MSAAQHKRTRKGLLNKLHGGIGRKEQWNTYYFEVLKGVYFHYRKDDRKEPTQILVNTIIKVVPSSRGSPSTFEVHHKGKGSPWILDAETEEEMISWMEALQPDSSRQIKDDLSRRKTMRAAQHPGDQQAGVDDSNLKAQRYVQLTHPQQQQQHPQQHPQQQQQHPQQQQQYPQQQYTQQQQHYPQQQQHYPQQQQQYPQQPSPYSQQWHQYSQQGQQYSQQPSPYSQQRHQYPQQGQQYPQQQQTYLQHQQYPQQRQQNPLQQQQYPQQQQQHPQQGQQYPQQQPMRSSSAVDQVSCMTQHPVDLNLSLPADAMRSVYKVQPPPRKQFSIPSGMVCEQPPQYLQQPQAAQCPNRTPPTRPRAYEVFTPSPPPPPVKDEGYVVMSVSSTEDRVSPLPGNHTKVDTPPPPNHTKGDTPPPPNHTKGDTPSPPKKGQLDDKFRYLHSDQIPVLAHLLENVSTAQGSPDTNGSPMMKMKQLDTTAVNEALGSVDENLLEQSDDDPKKKWTRATSMLPVEESAPDDETDDGWDELSREALTIHRSQLSNMKAIGKGQYGQVFFAELRYAPEAQPIEVAVKSTKSSAKETEMKSFNKEIKTMASLCHPNVVKMYGVMEEEGRRNIVLEYLALGDLRAFLKKNDRPVKRLVKYMYDVAAGMHYLASKGLVHRDLAARNVLVGADEVCKVADMGLLREVDEGDLYTAQSSLALPLRWMAPECIEELQFSAASDVWSFGIFMWELFYPNEKHPYPKLKNAEVKMKVTTGFTMQLPEDAHPTIKRIMKECWQLDPDKRPSFLLISTLLFKCHLQLV